MKKIIPRHCISAFLCIMVFGVLLSRIIDHNGSAKMLGLDPYTFYHMDISKQVKKLPEGKDIDYVNIAEGDRIPDTTRIAICFKEDATEKYINAVRKQDWEFTEEVKKL